MMMIDDNARIRTMMMTKVIKVLMMIDNDHNGRITRKNNKQKS